MHSNLKTFDLIISLFSACKGKVPILIDFEIEVTHDGKIIPVNGTAASGMALKNYVNICFSESIRIREFILCIENLMI